MAGMADFFNESRDKNSMSSKKDQRVRSAALSRDTNETKIVLAINLDGGAFPDNTDSKLTKGEDGHATQVSKSQVISINSGIGFLDHMLHALAKHAGWSLALICKGDLHSKNSEALIKITEAGKC
jgi:imidazoleglycerol-phosphate dehydratase